jgi:hypothetical protein
MGLWVGSRVPAWWGNHVKQVPAPALSNNLTSHISVLRDRSECNPSLPTKGLVRANPMMMDERQKDLEREVLGLLEAPLGNLESR